ncbi:hypothetical protein [Streptomyces sp. NPDC016845]|uniref:hypothetical protein n=1 Tax=Streptomyces sp. NPDC016845 TaxID=3364972 RepID=UPI0037B5816F
MSARDDIAAHFTSDTLVDQLLDAYRDEMLRSMAVEIKALGDERGWSIWAAHYMHPDVEFVDTGGLDSATLLRRLKREHRVEVLLEGAVELERIADETESRVAEHYGPASGIGPGSAEMVREAARTLREMAGEKATAPATTATPNGPLGAGQRSRIALLRRAVSEYEGEWTTARVAHLYQATYGPESWRAAARRDLAQLCAEGLLVLHDLPNNRHYTLTTRPSGDRDA